MRWALVYAFAFLITGIELCNETWNLVSFTMIEISSWLRGRSALFSTAGMRHTEIAWFQRRKTSAGFGLSVLWGSR